MRSMVVTANGAPAFLGVGDFVYRTPNPPAFVRSERSSLVDANGHVYLDAEAANGAAGLGYDATLLADAVARVGALPGLPSFCESELRIKVAQRLASRVDAAAGVAGKVAFDLGGAQAIELALKIARHDRPGGIAVFEGAYHGRSLFTSKLSASRRYRRTTDDWQPQLLRLPFPDTAQCRLGHAPDACADACLRYVRTTLDAEYAGFAGGAGETPFSVLLIEPVLNVAGMVFPDPRYVEGVVAEFRRRGALVIVDEVFTGFYRTGPQFGFQRYDFTPDVVVLSKALSNGLMPVSCVWARDPLLSAEHFPPGTHSVTFGNNPVAMAIADTVLDRYDAMTDLPERLRAIESSLSATIAALVRRGGAVTGGEAHGAVARVVFDAPLAPAVRAAAMTIGRERPFGPFHGLVLAATGMAPDVINIHPPYVITDDELAALGAMLTAAVAAVQARD